ncbi:hypothetical protein SAMN05660297_00634 [Natronincola peptidivorans]|uniref:Amidohydrolase 3 domain-containing protein n=1 Tax=Natronincola peptidivorans TaxID=426128 RepID=A0A1H9ZNG3_9FIRM|nr:amidohydrolase [Natronincola peptidivorans]SES82880.1 hypothetical protein SAMN05660297_00634 [Natronincola peptidivorans]
MHNKNLLLYNGKIITLSEARPAGEWVYIKKGMIEDIGIGEGYKAYIFDAEVINLKGATVVPGLIDSHVHLMETALNVLSNHLGDCGCIQDILDLLKTAKEEKTEWGTMIHCIGLEEINLHEKRMPTRWELDQVVKNKLVWISTVEYHVSVVNTLGFRLLNLPFNLPGIERDEEGVPTGVLRGRANFLARKKLLGITSDETRGKGVREVFKKIIAAGVTTINAMEGGFLFHDRDAVYVHKNLKKFPIDVELFFQTTDINKVKKMHLKKIGGCIFVDGSFGSSTAALENPYTDNEENKGTLFFTKEEITTFATEAVENNLDVTVHAIGTRALSLVLEAYKIAIRKNPNSTSIMRIEHFELPTKEQIETAVRLGIILSMQPAYEYFWGGEGKMYQMRLGDLRRRNTNPFATIIANGGIIAGGSDSDVTPINPLLGIHGAVNHPTIEERVSPIEALKMFTINGAIAIGKEDIKGRIAKDYIADLCLLDKNPLEIDVDKIKDIQVLGTIKNGEVLYLSEEISAGGEEVC